MSSAISAEYIDLGRCSPQTGHTTLNSTLHRKLENQAPNTTDSNHLYNNLELLMMGIQVPPKHVEQAIRSAIKIQLLHLVGILFPRNNIHLYNNHSSSPLVFKKLSVKGICFGLSSFERMNNELYGFKLEHE
jgi:hypothetical protein